MTRGLHHIALGARDVEGVARFYAEIFELDEVARHKDEAGELRSIWLDLGGPILMVERTHQGARAVQGIGAGPFLLAFSVVPAERGAVEERLRARGAAIEERSAFTSYARDPEGNRVAVSHYPEPGEAL
jgi:glyoxylase I family protein